MRSPLNFAWQAFSGLRLRLLVMMLLACAPLVALVFHASGEDRRRAKAGWLVQSRVISRIAKKEEKEIADSTRQVLLAASESSGVRSLDRESARHSLFEIHKAHLRYANLGLIATNGDVLASVYPVRDTNFSGHSFFKRALERREFSVGTVPSLSGNGNPIVHFGHPVLDGMGNVTAIVYADLDMNNHCRNSQIPSFLDGDTTWTVVDTQGRIISLYAPEGPAQGPTAVSGTIRTERVGKKMTDTWLLTNVLSQISGVLEGPDGRGRQNVYAFSPLRTRFAAGEVIGILGTTQEMLFADADRMLARNLRTLAFALAFALVLGWIGSKLLILRPVKALVRSSKQLAAGDLSVRTGLKPSQDELGQLTSAFDQMAQALETRELEHQRASQKLQVLSHRLVEVQEAERRHIARELHDEIGQSLTAAGMNLQAALQSPRAASLQKRLEDSIQAVEHVLEQVHDLSLNLRPSMLDDLGLESALRWYTHRQATLAGIRAEFEAEPLQERLDAVVETECFRIAQEALTNVVRHAQARSVRVGLTRENASIHLRVNDDGIGFDVGALRDEAVRGASLGLLSMEERASLAGGGLELTSVPGKGTEVHAWFPLICRNGNTSSVLNE